MGIYIVTIVLLLTIILLITEKLAIDVTAIGIIVILMITGVLEPGEAVAGFSNPAVITVGAMFLISRAMIRTGAVSFLGHYVNRLAERSSTAAMSIVLVVVAVASSFINNTPVVVLFIPIVMSMCCQIGLSPSRFLIPISYASILAGTCTLIGTSTNIIVSDLSASSGYGSLTMFELSKVGIPIAVVGIIFILLTAKRLLPDMHNPTCELDDPEHRRYLAELTVPKGSPLKGLDPCQTLSERYPGIEVLELIRYSHIFYPCRDHVTIAPDDRLLVKGTSNALVEMLHSGAVEIPRSEAGLRFGGPEETFVVEMIIPPQSFLTGQRLRDTYIMRDENLHVIAIKRSNMEFSEKQIQDTRLKMGDILLVWLPADRLDRYRGRSDFIIVEDVHHEIVVTQKAPVAGVIFTAMVLSAATGLADIMICALTAVLLMIVTGCLQIKDAYRALQGNVLMLIAGTIALGTAMQKTGAGTHYARIFLSVLDGWPPNYILAAFILLTSISTHILSNNATAVLLLPIAMSTALDMGVSPRPFIVAVCLGASACFASPIGYQTNLLVYGPGAYRFTDYLKMGIPLNLIVLIMGAIMIPWYWPF